MFDADFGSVQVGVARRRHADLLRLFTDNVRQAIEMQRDHPPLLHLADDLGRAVGKAATIGEERQQDAQRHLLGNDLRRADIDDGDHLQRKDHMFSEPRADREHR